MEMGHVETMCSSAWYVDCEVGGKSFECLIDSGASYSVIDKKVYDRMKNVPKLKPVDLSLQSASGDYLVVHGEVTLTMDVQGFCCEVTFKVVNLGNQEVIIGIEFLEQYDCVLKLASGIMEIGNKTVVLHKQGESQCARIVAANTITVPAHCEMILPAKIWPNKFIGTYGLVEPHNKVSNLRVIGALVATNSLQKNDVPVRVVNSSADDVIVSSGTILASMNSVVEVADYKSAEKENLCHVKQVNNILPEHLQPLLDEAAVNLQDSQIKKLQEILIQYQDAFVGCDGKIGVTNMGEHTIDTGDSPPIKQAPRRIPIGQREAVEKELTKLQEQGMIGPSDSPWSSPLCIVKKKDGSLRICVDYRKVNAVTKKLAYPLPRIDECLESLAGSQWYCSLDLQSSYHQVKVAEADRCKTAFATRSGLMEYAVLPFGLTNGPSCFQRLMETCLRPLLWKRCLLFIDDILPFGRTFDETLENLTLVLQRLQGAKLKLKPSKCHLFQTSVKFLGHVVSKDGISCDPAKTDAVTKWPEPQSVTDVRSFLGLASYYRKHVKNFSEISACLYDLTKKGVKFEWTEECRSAFEQLKDCLVNSPVLAFPNNEGKFILDTDASLHAVGAVLSQVQNGEERVIAYASKSLSASERNYCTTMRELLAVVVFVKQFHHFLASNHFLLRTDHASLKWLMNFKEPQDMLARWLSILGSYDFEIQHRSGVLHGNADALSRYPRRCKRQDCGDCARNCKSTAVNVLRKHTRRRKRQDDEDGAKMCKSTTVNVLTRSLKLRRENENNSQVSVERNMDNDDGQSGTKDNDETEESRNKYLPDEAEAPPRIIVDAGESLDVGSGDTDLNSSIPGTQYTKCNWADGYSTAELKKYQDNDPDIRQIIQWKMDADFEYNKVEKGKFSHDIKVMCVKWEKLLLKDGLLYRHYTSPTNKKAIYMQLVVPRELRTEIMEWLHDHKCSAHLGRSKSMNKLLQRFYWPGYKSDVARWCQRCRICQSFKPEYKPAKAPMQKQIVDKPMQRVACDFVGPVPVTENGNMHILVVCDYFTKYAEAYAVPDQTAQTAADVLVTQWICRYGVMDVLHSDQGRNFESELFKEVCDLLGIHKTRTSRFRPQSDGLVERFNRTLKSMLRAMTAQCKNEWDEHLPYVMMAYRATVQESTKSTPNLLMYGRELTLPVDIMFPMHCQIEDNMCPIQYVEWLKTSMQQAFEYANTSMKKTAQRQLRSYNKQTCWRTFKPGDWAWIFYPPDDRPKFGVGWSGPYLVTDRLGSVNYKVQKTSTSNKITVHIDNMKTYTHTTPNSWLTSATQNMQTQTE